MATATDYARLRRDTGTNSTTLPDATAAAYFTEAAEVYSDATVAAVYTRVLVLQGLLASAAPLTTYRQNETSQNASDLYAHYERLLKTWEGKVADALKAASGGGVKSGRTTRKPTRIYEYPGA